MALNVLINNSPVIALYALVGGTMIDAKVNQRDTVTFGVKDDTGSLVISENMPVNINDDTLGALYDGFVDKVDAIPYPGQITTVYTVTCKDNHWLADKRVWSNNELTNMYGGDIACLIHQRYLNAEGVTANYAMEYDDDATSFSTGTLNGVLGTSNGLILRQAGSNVTISESVTSDFSSGTLTNCVASSNTLAPTQLDTGKTVCTLASAGSGAFIYYKFWAGTAQTVGTNDTLYYDIMIQSSSPAFAAAVNLGFSDSTNTRTENLKDQNGFSNNPSTDLSTIAKDVWYTRQVPLGSSNNGKSVTKVTIDVAGQAAGTYTVFFRNVYLGSNSGTPFFSTTSSTFNVNPPTVDSFSQYNNTSGTNTVVQSFNSGNAYRVSPSHSIDSVKMIGSTTTAWSVTTPNATKFALSVSYDGGNSYYPCTQGGSLPLLPPGSNVAGASIIIKEAFTQDPANPTSIPVLSSVTITINSASGATTGNMSSTYATQASFNTGTYSGTKYSSGLTIATTSTTRDWNDNTISNQTFYTYGSPSQSASGGKYKITCGGNASTEDWAISRLDFAGTVANFSLDIDISIPSVSCGAADVSIIYGTTNWPSMSSGAAFGNYGYFLLCTPTGNQLGFASRLYKGNNSGSGTFNGSGAILATGTVTSPTHVKIVYNNGSHKIYFNGSSTPDISVTDSTYTSGQIGVGNISGHCSTSYSGTATFDNFSITPLSQSGTWTSPGNDLTSLTTCGGSVVSWVDSNIVSGTPTTTDTIQSSIDGGSTWSNCTNGSTIPGLTNGTALSGKNLKFKSTLTTTDITATDPILNSLSWNVLSQFPGANGTRNSIPLDLSHVGRIGTSIVTWNASVPANTTMSVSVSQDNVTFYPVLNGNPIPFFANAPAQALDFFNIDTTTNYTLTNYASGSNTTWSINAGPRQLSLTGGTNALAIWSMGAAQHTAVYGITSQCEASGMVARYVDTNNFYAVVVCDGSAAVTPNTVTLIKRVSGTTTTLSTVTQAFTRGTYHTIELSVIDTNLVVSFDGTQIISTTDSSLSASGSVGFLNNTGNSIWWKIQSVPVGAAVSGSLYIQIYMSTSSASATPTMSTFSVCIRDNSIVTGALVPKTSDQYKTCSTMLDDIAKQSGTWWGIDQSMQLHFQTDQSIPANWVVDTSTSDVLYNVFPKYTLNSPLYRNKQWITDAYDTVNVVDTRIGDGHTTSWQLSYPVASMTSVLLNGSPANVGISNVTVGAQFYYTLFQQAFTQDKSQTVLASTDVLTITYLGSKNYTAMYQDTNAQAFLASIDKTSGIVEASESATATSGTAAVPTLNKAAADALAQARVQQYGSLTKAWEFQTLRSGLVVGQMLTVFSDKFGISNGQFLITEIRTYIDINTDGTPLYTYDIFCVDGTVLGTWHRYFEALK